LSTPFVLPGKVYLIGAGPGAADLLTVRAAQLLQSADIVLHDDLVSDEVLALISPRATVQSVGKRCGIKKITQEEIQNRMIAEARSGKTVIRLKGGDPLIFGRASEEMAALRAAGIPFEIVPGITAALAAAAVAQISLTDRHSASKLLLVSNHQCGEKIFREWHTNVVSDSTLVFYMPGGHFEELVTELSEAGLTGDTPCLMVSNAARPQQEFHRTTLKDLASVPHLPAPSLLIVGAMTAESQNVKIAAKPEAKADAFKLEPKLVTQTRIQLAEEYAEKEASSDKGNWLATEAY